MYWKWSFIVLFLLNQTVMGILLTPERPAMENYTAYKRLPTDPKKPSNPIILSLFLEFQGVKKLLGLFTKNFLSFIFGKLLFSLC
jgi:hypothetical protein